MNEQIQRNPDGTFPKGISGNPKGRAPKQREAALLAIGQEIVTHSAWRSVVVKAVLDAQGKRVEAGQKIVDDPDSTAQGRNTARVWLRDTFIGKPDIYVKSDSGESAYSQLNDLSDAELAGLLDEIRGEIESARVEGGDSASGVDEAGGE